MRERRKRKEFRDLVKTSPSRPARVAHTGQGLPPGAEPPVCVLCPVLLDVPGRVCSGEVEGVRRVSYFSKAREILLFNARLCVSRFPGKALT